MWSVAHFITYVLWHNLGAENDVFGEYDVHHNKKIHMGIARPINHIMEVLIHFCYLYSVKTVLFESLVLIEK